jgi:hypothetical protein
MKREYGMHDFLHKPFSLTDLATALAQWLSIDGGGYSGS